LRLLVIACAVLAPILPAEKVSSPGPWTLDAALVIKAKRVITVSGADITDGIVLIVDGKIKAVGKDIAIPDGATIIEAAVVMPGLVNASSSYGLPNRANEEAREVTPDARAIDDCDGGSGEFKRAVQTGVTTAYVGPGDRNVIGGLGAAVKTAGGKLPSRIISSDVALKAAFGPSPSRGNYSPRSFAPTNFYARRPTTRMGVTWECRKAFIEAKKYRDDKEANDDGKEILLRVLDKKLVLRVSASRATDIEAVLKIVEEFGFDIMLEEADEAYRHIEALARRKIPVLYRASFQTRTIYSRDGSEERFTTFADLVKAGVKTALLPTGDAESEGLLATATFTVKYGAAPAEALRAITLTPAELLGIANRVGSIEAGKDADLVLLNGDPLHITTRVERVLVDGKVVFGKPLAEY